MRLVKSSILAGVSLAVLASAALAQAKSPTPQELEFFEKKIRPVLVQHCYECHSAGSKSIKGGLVLDTQAGLLKGGESGAAIVPGNAKESLLIEALQYDGLEMPPKTQLPAKVVADFVKWIDSGAADPRVGKAAAGPRTIDFAAARNYWAFQPPHASPAPSVKNAAWPRTDLDRFVLARLEAKNIAPVADADRRTLIRRATFDITGLPPTPEEVAAFVADKSPKAFEKVIDRLLATPQYGERWGRHWLDVARYGESTGKERNVPYPFAWRYRDYVIDAFSADKPFDQFIREQIAGDLLPAASDPERAEHRIATGFLAIGVKGLNEKNSEQYLMDEVDEQLDTTTRAVLAITVGCARCHDHKFDPIPSTDYYAMAGIFRSTDVFPGVKRGSRAVEQSSLFAFETKPASTADPKRQAEAKELLASLDEAQAKLREARDVAEGKKKLNKQKKRDKNDQAKERVADAKSEVEKLESRLKELGVEVKPTGDLAMAVGESRSPGDCQVCIRGEVADRGPSVPRGFVTVLKSPDDPKIEGKRSGRLELAEWLASSRNPLTARVMVNRIWAHLFGVGIVETVDNFGELGDRPSHPELLDELALEFVNKGWSVKQTIRSIMLSRTYQLASDHNEAGYAADPTNRLLWRMNRRRLDAESLRDSLLATSGQIDLKRPVGSLVAEMGDAETGRGANLSVLARQVNYRSVYLPILRGVVPEMLNIFDIADPSLVVGQREVTTVATQALFMMNSPLVMAQADKVAERVLADPSLDDAARIDLAYGLILARSATAGERERIVQFLGEFRQSLDSESKDKPAEHAAAWASLCQTLYASAEFRYLY